MVLTPEKFIRTDMGFVLGVLLIALSLITLLRSGARGRRSPTGIMITLGLVLLGGYVVARHQGYQF